MLDGFKCRKITGNTGMLSFNTVHAVFNNAITISRQELKGYILRFLTKTYYIHENFFLYNLKQKRYENSLIHRFSNYLDL